MSVDVITTLYGNVGNQLFQYAATLKALRDTGGSTFRLIKSGGTWPGAPDITKFLGVPTTRVRLADRARWSELAAAPGPLRHVLTRSARIGERLSDRQVVHQSTPFDAAQKLRTGARVKMEGFFQHPSWYHDTWREVAIGLLERAPDGFADLSQRSRVGLQIRRTDYVAQGWDLSPEFYLTALPAMGITDCEIVGMSDEPSFLSWFAEVVKPLGCRVVAPEPLTGGKAEDDFWNLAACSVVIPANSTFSWWSAAVATARDSLTQVAYPMPWIPNRWGPDPVPDLGLAGWRPFPSGLPDRA